MIASFFGNAEDTHRLFEPLRIAGERDDYTTHLNQHHVIFIDFSISPINSTSYAQYIRRIQTGLNTDLAKAYPDLEIKPSDSPWDVLNTVFQNTGEKFIFVMDEWDAAFYFPYMTESDRAAHLHFLKLLLKGQSYVEFAYMTGVLPIAKYSSGSELNMFAEYDMVVYGLLTYDSDAREVFIPNRELMDQFDALLLNNPNPGYADFIFSPEQPSRSSSYRIFSIPIF